jgi:hypothetical protein
MSLNELKYNTRFNIIFFFVCIFFISANANFINADVNFLFKNPQRLLTGNHTAENEEWIVNWDNLPTTRESINNYYHVLSSANSVVSHIYSLPDSFANYVGGYTRLLSASSENTNFIISNTSYSINFAVNSSSLICPNEDISNFNFNNGYNEISFILNNNNYIIYINGLPTCSGLTSDVSSKASIQFIVNNNANIYITDIMIDSAEFVPATTNKVITFLSPIIMTLLYYSFNIIIIGICFGVLYFGIKIGQGFFKR